MTSKLWRPIVALLFFTLQSDQYSVATDVLEDSSVKLPPITAVAIDPHTARAIQGSQAGLLIRTWPELTAFRALPTSLENIHDLKLSPDGKFLAVAGGVPAESGAIELFSWPKGELLKRLEPHRDLVNSLAWRADSQLLALASADNTTSIFSVANLDCVRVLEGHSRPVLAVEFLPDELGLLTGGVDQSLRCWEYVAGASSKISPKRALSNHTRPVIDLAMQPALDSEIPLVASIAEDFTVRLWHPTIGRMIRFAKLESMPTAVCWIGGGKFLAVACGDGKVRVVNPETVEITQIREALSGPAYCIEADPAGNVLVGGIDGQLRVLTDLLSTLPATATADAAGR